MNRIKRVTAAVLLTSFVAVPTLPAQAKDQNRRDRYEDRWDRREDRQDRREDRWDRREDRWDSREDRRDRREDRWDRREDRYDERVAYWDAARYYRRDDRRYGPRRLGRNDRIYRGSDSRYYCKRDDGTTGLIIGGISGGVLGHIIAPGGSRTLGTIIGAGAGALIGPRDRRRRRRVPLTFPVSGDRTLSERRGWSALRTQGMNDATRTPVPSRLRRR